MSRAIDGCPLSWPCGFLTRPLERVSSAQYATRAAKLPVLPPSLITTDFLLDTVSRVERDLSHTKQRPEVHSTRHSPERASA